MKNLGKIVNSLLIFMGCLVFSSSSFSQENSDFINTPGKWIYTNNNLSNEWFGEQFYKMNAAELSKYHSTIDKLVNYFQQQSVAQKPIGTTLNAESRAAYNHYDHDSYPVKPNERVKAEVYIPFCRLLQNGGKKDFDCIEVPYIKVRTNDETMTYESAMSVDIIDDKQAMKQYREIFFLPNKLLDLGSGIYLYDGYKENRIVISSNKRPLWIPITNKEYTQRMLAYYTAQVKEGISPQMIIDALKEEIAGVPSDLLNMPAYTNGDPKRPLTGICSIEEDSTNALYIINPKYFDLSLPRTFVQLITITIEGHADDPDFGDINAHRVWELIIGLKGNDLKKLLDID